MVSKQELEDLDRGLLSQPEEEAIRLELLLRKLIGAAEGLFETGLPRAWVAIDDAIATAKAHLGDVQ